MRRTRLTILLTLITIWSYGQQYNFDLDKVKFKGLGLKTSKKMIIEKFGQGKHIETNYDCGFFADGNSNAPYYQVVFDDFKFIGSDKENFYLRTVDFDLTRKTKIHYGDKVLNGQTTKDEFIKIFGEAIKKHFENPNNDAIVLITNGRDDGARFTFKNNQLIKFEYWTPC